jgi:hypothetical protein
LALSSSPLSPKKKKKKNLSHVVTAHELCLLLIIKHNGP